MFELQIFKYKNGKDLYIDADELDSSNWLRYVNCGRTPQEMNLKAIQFKDKVSEFEMIHPLQEFLLDPANFFRHLLSLSLALH